MFANRLPPPQTRRTGVAIVITLLCITVLTVIATAFLQSMSIERLTSRSQLNLMSAEEVAQSASDEALQKLTKYMAERPYHAIGYKTIQGQVTPVIMGSIDYGTAPEQKILVSGDPLNVTFANTPTPYKLQNWTNLNFKTKPADSFGWMGTPIVNGVPVQDADGNPVARKALWVNVLADPTLPEQYNPNQASYNPVVARYAYWVEDETSKLDISAAGNADGTGNRFLRSQIGDKVTDLDVSALPMLNQQPLSDDNTGGTVLSKLVNLRTSFPLLFKDSRILNRVSTDLPDNVAEQVKFHATTHSLSNELAGTGRRRVNLNALVTNSYDPKKIAADIDDIGWLITGKHVLMNSNPGLTNETSSGLFLDQPDLPATNPSVPAPDFGERLFFENTAFPNKSQTYLTKLGTNIRDYIDADSQPTVVDETGRVMPDAAPVVAPWNFKSGTAAMAIGKEGVPYLDEHAWRGYIESWTQTGKIATATLRFDHYFEFYNPTTKNYTAPAGTFIKIYNLPLWSAGSLPDLRLEDFTCDLSGIVFLAGSATVITTNDSGAHPPGLMLAGTPKAVTPVPIDGVLVTGVKGDQESTSNNVKAYGFSLAGRSVPNRATDYETEFLIGNTHGIISFFPAISISLFSHRWNITSRGDNVGSQTRFVYASSLKGNLDFSGAFEGPNTTGDPLSLTEQLKLQDYASPSSDPAYADQTRFFGGVSGHSDSGGSSIPGTSTFGQPANQFIKEALWPDFTQPLTNSANTAYIVIADQKMRSIGELGNIYDPFRKARPGGSVLVARGGGRTLKIGQKDDVVAVPRFATRAALDANPYTPGWRDAAWHLTDIFSAHEDVTKKTSDPTAPGKLNINGVLRDDGVAFRAVLRKFNFLPSPAGAVTRSGNLITESEITSLISQIKAYLSDPGKGPFMERGELSELDFFSGSQTAGGIAGSNTMDRGREEIFRRTVELITTRSAIFSVYCAAEVVEQRADGSLFTRGRRFKKITSTLNPMHNNQLLIGSQVADRADAFRTELVSVERP